MKELLEYIVKNLVDDKVDAVVSLTTNDDVTEIVISVAENDIGKVIGRQGKVISSIRTLVKSIGIKNGIKYNVEIAGGEKKSAKRSRD